MKTNEEGMGEEGVRGSVYISRLRFIYETHLQCKLGTVLMKWKTLDECVFVHILVFVADRGRRKLNIITIVMTRSRSRLMR